MLVIPILLVLAGVALLYWGGELLVGNSIAMARAFGVSAMVIGLTVVAFATSAPELAAALTANLRGSPDIAVGNVVGSNIANVGLILGSTALFFALPATRRFLRRELAFMIVATVLVYPLMLGGLVIHWIEGGILVLALVWFLYTLLTDPEHQVTYPEVEDTPPRPLWRSSLGVAVGLGLLVAGAQALVEGASDIARAVGVPERVIGLTLVALGTSLPELAAAFAAARKGEGDLVMGNVVGSNIFNLLCILGITGLVSPITVAPEVLRLDYWVMFGTSLLLMGFLGLRLRLSHVEGAVLLGIYLAYTIFLYVT